jgi:ribosome biogenesis GTPase A
LENNEKLVLTPFEKNLDIWRQLWRVLERCDLVVMVVDARNPLFHQCPDLEVKSNHAPFVGLNLKVAVSELLDKDPG